MKLWKTVAFEQTLPLGFELNPGIQIGNDPTDDHAVLIHASAVVDAREQHG
jgi:hypothetical protein